MAKSLPLSVPTTWRIGSSLLKLSDLVGLGGVIRRDLGWANLGLVMEWKSKAGCMGRVARQGSDIGFCGIGGMGRLAREGSDIGSGRLGGKGRLGRLVPKCGARSDRDGSALSKSGEIRAKAEGRLGDRASTWRASGEICA